MSTWTIDHLEQFLFEYTFAKGNRAARYHRAMTYLQKRLNRQVATLPPWVGSYAFPNS
jgi:hypothetical protein